MRRIGERKLKNQYNKHNGNCQNNIIHQKQGSGQGERPLYTIDGEVSKLNAYQMINQAKKGSVFFRIIISPDKQKEDTHGDLYLWQITEQTIVTLEERLKIHVPFIAAEHDDHSDNRHVHLLALAKARIEPQDLKVLRDSATEAALSQRQQHDLAREAKQRAIEEVQWAY